MTPVRAYRVPSPLPFSLLLVLCTAYLLPGLVDHDPWKADDAVSMGIVFEALHGNWLVPTLAGESYAQVSPLYFWVATLFAKLFSAALPLHAGARLASAAFTGAAVTFTAFAAREQFGATAATSAALILIGCAGLLLQAHAMTAELALLAAFAAVLWGLTLIAKRPLAAGAITGSAIGAAFLAHGLAPALTALLLTGFMLLMPASRRQAARVCGVLVLSALPWFLLWPLALYFQAPQFLRDWWEAANLAQLPGTSDATPLMQALAYLKLLGWFAWPALPLALWTLWQFRRRLKELVLPLAAFVLFLAMLSFGSDAREVTAVSLLLPLTLLGAACVGELRRGAANALDWFGMMTFSLFALVVWAVYVAMQWGVPAELAQRFTLAEPGYVAHFNALTCGIAVIFTLAWIALIVRTERSPHRGVTHWAAGVTVAWGVATALLLPWIDYGRSYRGLSAELLPRVANGGCVASRNLGEPQRASLHYFANLVTVRAEVADAACDLMLVQGSATDDSGNPGTGWDFIWQGNRPGDRSERYRLYRRRH
jgi:4-amino-4-deoxy-L-arabinose transferase-like glycosyltransferase